MSVNIMLRQNDNIYTHIYIYIYIIYIYIYICIYHTSSADSKHLAKRVVSDKLLSDKFN